MKKRIISAVLSAAMLGTSVFSVPFVSAETELITDTEKIYDLAKAYVEENLPGDAKVVINENGIVLVTYRQTAIGETEFNSDDFQKFLQEKNVDFTKIVIEHLDDVPAAAPADTDKITDLEQIAALLKKYIDENHPGDAVVVFEEDGTMHVTFRKTAIGEEEFDGEIIYWNMAEYLEENNVDSSFISNKFTVSFLAAAPADGVTVSKGDLNCDGTIDVTDLSNLSLVLIGDMELTADQKLAADVDGDGEITLADLAKLRQYLSKKISKREFENITLVSIVDLTERDMLSVPAAIEKFYEDENFVYEFGGIKSSYVECTFSDGTVMNVKDALAGGMVTISDLDKYGINYRRTTTMIAAVKEVKGDTLFLTSAEGSKELRSSDLIAVKWDSADQRFKAGDTVRVEYNGIVIATYPEQIDAYSISLYTETTDK